MTGLLFNKKIGHFFLYSFFIFFFNIAKVSATTSLPKILNVYPECSYKTIDDFSVKDTTETPFSDETSFPLLKKLQKEAKRLGADAVIVVHKDIKKQLNSNVNYRMSADTVHKYNLTIKAELIALCEPIGTSNNKLTPYNEKGHKQQKVGVSSRTLQTQVVVEHLNKFKLYRPRLTNTEISLGNGVYGIQIGTSYQQVMTVLGDPSIELKASKHEVILGYGRSHWYHFINNVLVKVQSHSPDLSPELLNEIPLLDFFDDNVWQIAGKIKRKATLAEVKAELGQKIELNNKNELIISDKGNTLTLYFRHGVNYESQKKIYTLDSFSLQENTYKKLPYHYNTNRDTQFAAINNMYTALEQNSKVDVELFKAKLGSPIGKIRLSLTSSLDLYNSNLLVETRSSGYIAVNLVEQLFSKANNVKVAPELWSFARFTQGKSIDQLRGSFPTNAYVASDNVQWDTDDYELSLFFDEINDQDSLYKIRIVVY